MATIRNVMERLRKDRLDDFPYNTAQDWLTDDTGMLWTNAQLLEYLNESAREFTRRRPILDSTTASVCQYSVSAGQHVEIAIDSRVLVVKRAKLASQVDPLKKTHREYLDDEWPDWVDETAIPEWYFENLNEYKIKLIGTLSATDTLDLTILRMPLNDMVWPQEAWAATTAKVVDDLIYPTSANLNGHYYKVTVAGTTGSSEPTWPTNGGTVADGTVTWQDEGLIGGIEIPEINSRHHYDLLDYACSLAYLKRDSEAFDLKTSEYYEARFLARVGPRPSAAVEERRRRSGNLRMRTKSYYR